MSKSPKQLNFLKIFLLCSIFIFSVLLSGCEESRKIIFYNATKAQLYSEVFKETLKNGYQITSADEKKGLLVVTFVSENSPYQNTSRIESSNTASMEFIDKPQNKSVEINVDFKGNVVLLIQYKSTLLKNIAKKFPRYEIYGPDGERMNGEEKF